MKKGDKKKINKSKHIKKKGVEKNCRGKKQETKLKKHLKINSK